MSQQHKTAIIWDSHLRCRHFTALKMPLMTDDLDIKYGVVSQNDVADKKKRKKSKGRTLEIDFPLHSNGLIQSYESSISYDTNDQKVIPAYSADIPVVGNDCSDVINQLLPTVRDAMQPTTLSRELLHFREFLYDVGSRACEIEEINEPFQLSNSNTALSSNISSLSNPNNSDQLLTLLKGTLNSTSGVSIAQTKPLSAITNDFTNRLPQQYLNGTETMGQLDNEINSHQKVVGGTMVHKRLSADELLVQQNGDIFMTKIRSWWIEECLCKIRDFI
ncbi:hypothetical protein DINM_004302 [Dirofilaria immitis]|nr:hypothetical protein [Dirofilaria immitis]